MIPKVLTIAGSDPSGGAGVQADLKTFSALGAYGMSVITALTAQSTQGVSGVYVIPAAFVTAQCDALFADVSVDAVKIGMLGDEERIRCVAAVVRTQKPPLVVLDPVMVAKGGHRLLSESAIDAMLHELLPLADVVTPNLPEAAALLQTSLARTEEEMCEQGRAILARGARAVLMKGGHLDAAESPDWLVTEQQAVRFAGPRIVTKHTHGTGCSLSAALAALRPQCPDWIETITQAKAWLVGALADADRLKVGHGIGPVHHFHKWW